MSSHDRRWNWHPTVRSGKQLSLGERAADLLKSYFGRWSALGLVTAVIIFWLLFVRDPGELRLNLALSCMAAVQGIILQISANRGDRIASELALHDHQMLTRLDQLVNCLHRAPETGACSCDEQEGR